jgi:hypothetical protein
LPVLRVCLGVLEIEDTPFAMQLATTPAHARAATLAQQSEANMRLLTIVATGMLLAGCATPNTGVVPIGNGIYMHSKFGSMVTFSGGEVKAELFQEAAQFCAKQGKQLVPVNSTSKDSGVGTYASAEIQFRCD